MKRDVCAETLWPIYTLYMPCEYSVDTRLGKTRGAAEDPDETRRKKPAVGEVEERVSTARACRVYANIFQSESGGF